jgi:hypothetical protein
MPQRTSRHPLVATLTQQATKALAALRQEITQREQDLVALKAEAARWQSAMRGPVRRARPAVAPSQAPPPKRLRLDWSAILQELPIRFTTQEVAQKAGKPIGHVYVYVSRWMKDKKVRRVKEGYQKVSRKV